MVNPYNILHFKYKNSPILAYMSSPCHIEVILAEKLEIVSKPFDDVEKVKKESKKKQKRILARGDF